MKTALVSAVVAAVVALLALHIDEIVAERSAPNEPVPVAGPEARTRTAPQSVPGERRSLSYTTELVEDAWVDGARTAGIDHKPLAHSANSVCYLTKVEIRGIQGPDDTNVCRIEIDDFTEFWEVVAEVEEGGQSEVRCNARCLVWE